MLGLCCCAWTFSSCSEQGLLSSCRAWASHCRDSLQSTGCRVCRFRSCGAQVLLLQGMWDLPRPGLKPVAPASTGRVLTTGPPGELLQQPLNCVSTSSLVPLLPHPALNREIHPLHQRDMRVRHTLTTAFDKKLRFL